MVEGKTKGARSEIDEVNLISVADIYTSQKTYASFRLAKLELLSLGFLALAAAFFAAFSRACSRWLPPDHECIEARKHRIEQFIDISRFISSATRISREEVDQKSYARVICTNQLQTL